MSPDSPDPRSSSPGEKRSITLIFYSHSACSLCDRLEELLAPHLETLRQSALVTWIDRNITADRRWLALYQHRVPVLTDAEGRVILEGRPEAEQVAAAVAHLVP